MVEERTTQRWPANSAEAAVWSEGQILDLILDVETAVRELIERLFTRKRTDWERLIPESVRQHLEELCSKDEHDSFVIAKRTGSLLAFASLSELEGILASRWDHFQPMLGRKSVFLLKLEELRHNRNALAHGARAQPDDRVRAYLLARELRERIPSLYVPVPRAPGQPGELRAVAQATTTEPESDDSFSAVRVRWLRMFLEERLPASYQLASLGWFGRLRCVGLSQRGRTIHVVAVGQSSLAVLTHEPGRRRVTQWLTTLRDAEQVLIAPRVK